MKRSLPTLAALVTAGALLLGACSGSDTVRDPAGSPGGATESVTSSPEPRMIGGHPAYPVSDYTYDLETQCFCALAGQPVRITVEDGEVVSAVWTRTDGDQHKGDEVTAEWLRVSINDLLEEAANPRWDEVEVVYAKGAEHPERIAIDRMSKAVDDEVTYLISNVTPRAA